MLFGFLGNIVASATVAGVIVLNVERPLPETIYCERIVASQGVETRQVVTGYVWVGVPHRYGEQPAITLNAGNNFAGVQVTDGERCETLWVEKDR